MKTSVISWFAFIASASAAAIEVLPANTTQTTGYADYPDSYCGFYSDSSCNNQVGDVSFDVYNEGCFSSTGGYIRCGGGLYPDFIIVQSPNEDNNCNCQTNCKAFGQQGGVPNPWGNCVPINLTPGYTTFRIEHDMESCAPNNC